MSLNFFKVPSGDVTLRTELQSVLPSFSVTVFSSSPAGSESVDSEVLSLFGGINPGTQQEARSARRILFIVTHKNKLSFSVQTALPPKSYLFLKTC